MLAYEVSLRFKVIGIRLALGSLRGKIVKLLVYEHGIWDGVRPSMCDCGGSNIPLAMLRHTVFRTVRTGWSHVTPAYSSFPGDFVPCPEGVTTGSDRNAET